MAREKVGALIITPTYSDVQQRQIAELALRYRMPSMFGNRSYVDAGGLMSYGKNYTNLFRRSATYADKILKGANPRDLPVQQPVSFEFVVNLKTAKALGITVPPTVLLRADEVIE